MAENISIVVSDKVDASINTKLKSIAETSRIANSAVEALKKALAGLSAPGSVQALRNQLLQLHTQVLQNIQSQNNFNATNARAVIAQQRLATEFQRTQVQLQNLTTAQTRTATEAQRLITAQAGAAAAALRTAAAAAQLTTATNNAATAAQRLVTEQARTAQASTQAATAIVNHAAAMTNALTAASRLAEAQSRATRAATDATTATQRLATEVQRTAVQTSNAAAAADRARLAALQLAQAQQQQSQATSGAASSMLSYAKAAALAFGAAIGAQSVLQTADSYTILQNKLVNLAATQADVNLLTSKMFEIANRTGQSVEVTAGAFQKFDTAIMNLGGSQSESLRLIETLNKAVSVSGATTAEAASGILQLGQAFGAGKLGGDEFRAVMESLPAVADLIAKSLGVTRGELKALSTAGKLSTDVLRKAFAEAAGDIDTKFGKTTFTLAQGYTILNNRFIEFIGNLNKSLGVTSTLGNLLAALGNNLGAVAVGLTTVASLVLVAFGPQLLAMLGSAATAVKTFTLALAANPLGLLIVGIATATAAITIFGDKMKLSADGAVSIKDGFRTAFAYITDGFNATADYIKGVWNTAIDFVSSKTGGFGESFRNIGEVIKNAVKSYVNFVIASWIGAFNAIITYWKRLPDLLSAVFSNVVNAGASAVEFLVNSWQLGLRGISKLAENVAPETTAKLNKALDGVSLKLPRMDTKDSVSEIASDIGKQFSDAFGKDYVGDAADAFMKRARQIAADRAKLEQDPGQLRGKTNVKTPVAEDKNAIKRASALAKINLELDNQMDRLFMLKPLREQQAQFDAIEESLASKKIKLNAGEAASIKEKIKAIQEATVVQSEYDRLYEEAVSPMRNFNATATAANMLLAKGAITQTQAAEAITKANEAYKAASDPMYQYNKDLEQQFEVLKLIGPAQQIAQQMQQVKNDLLSKGVVLDQDATANLQKRLELLQRETAVNQEMNTIYNETTGAKQQLLDQNTALSRSYANGTIGLETYSNKLVQLGVDMANLKIQMGDATTTDTMIANLGRVVEGYQGLAVGLNKTFGDFFVSFTDGFAESIGKAVTTSEDLGEALRNVATQAVQSLISSLIKLGIQYVLNAALGQSLGTAAVAAQTATSVAAAGATAAAWAVPASLVSLASFGANSAPAMAGISATAALAEGLALTSAAGFETGGYTGNGGTKDVAGVVHGQEFVMDAKATRRIGVQNLQAMQNGTATMRENKEERAAAAQPQQQQVQPINMPFSAVVVQSKESALAGLKSAEGKAAVLEIIEQNGATVAKIVGVK